MYVRNIPSQEGHEFDKVCVMCMQVRRGRRSRGGEKEGGVSRGGVGRVKGSEAKYGRGWLGGGEGNNWRKKAPPPLE